MKCNLVFRHLLSADTKDERVHWCSQVNAALTDMRAWDPEAMRPTNH